MSLPFYLLGNKGSQGRKRERKREIEGEGGREKERHRVREGTPAPCGRPLLLHTFRVSCLILPFSVTLGHDEAVTAGRDPRRGSPDLGLTSHPIHEHEPQPTL